MALWVILSGRIHIQVFLLGTMICSLISHMLADNLFRLVKMKYGTKEIFLKIYYILLVVSAFIYDMFLSAIRVSRHAFEMKASFSPRIVRIKTSIENANSIVNFANFITLTQGTLAMDFDTVNKNYYVHWIDVHSDDAAEVKKLLISRHEKLIAKIFDSFSLSI